MSSFGNSLKYRREFTLVLLEYVEVAKSFLLSSWNSVKSQRILFFVLQEPLEVSAGTACNQREYVSFVLEQLEVTKNFLPSCRNSVKSQLEQLEAKENTLLSCGDRVKDTRTPFLHLGTA